MLATEDMDHLELPMERSLHKSKSGPNVEIKMTYGTYTIHVSYGFYIHKIIEHLYIYIYIFIIYTLQGTNIYHLGKRKVIFKQTWCGDMLVSQEGRLLPLFQSSGTLASSIITRSVVDLDWCFGMRGMLTWRDLNTHTNTSTLTHKYQTIHKWIRKLW